MSDSWFRITADAQILTLTLHVQPNARKTVITGLHGDALKIKIAAAAIDGQANAGLLAFLAKEFEVPLRQIKLKQGEHSRHKVIEIQGSSVNPVTLLSDVKTHDHPTKSAN